MSTAQFTTPLIVVIPGQLITASLWNGEYNNLFTNLNPQGIGGYSDNDTQMRAATDPFPGGSTSRPTDIAGEFQRLRYILNLIIGQTYWYQHPLTDLSSTDTDITALENRLPVQTVDIGDLQVTNAKINDVASTKITGTISTAQIANAAVDETKLAASVAGNGLSGGAGSPLAVVVDGTTIQISSDTLSIPNGGIGVNQVSAALKPKQPKTNVSSLITATSVNGIFGTVFSVTGAGALKGITLKADRSGGASSSSTFSIRITLDGVQYVVGGLVANFTNIYQIAAAAWANAKPPTLTNYFTSNAVAGTGSDFYFGFNASLLIELEATSVSDGANGFYVATSYEN